MGVFCRNWVQAEGVQAVVQAFRPGLGVRHGDQINFYKQNYPYL